MVDRTASRPQRSWRTSSAHARRCSTSSTARARTLPTRPPTPPTLTTSRTSVRSCRPHPPTYPPANSSVATTSHARVRCRVWTVFRLVWERDREGVNAELEAERAQHSAEISMRASQHIVQANALEHRAREEDMAVCVSTPSPINRSGFPLLSLSLSLSLMCVHAWRWKQAQRGLHELYATVADINAQEEGLPPAAKAREPAPSTKVPVKRPRESSAAASPAPAPAPVPAPAVSPAVQAPLQQRAPVAPTPAPDLHIDDDSSFSTQFVVVSLCLSLFLCVHRCFVLCSFSEKSMLQQGSRWNR